METLLHDFLSCVESLKKELIHQASRGERWVLGFEPCEELQPRPTSPSLKNNPAQVQTASPQKTFAKPSAASTPAPVNPVAVISETVKTPLLITVSQKTSYSIVFVRLCPSPAEQKSGKAYSDEGAAMLDKIIAAMKWNPEDVFKTYLCPTPPDSFTDEQFRESVSALHKQILTLRPKVVIAWGERLSQILSGMKENIETLHKKFIPHPQGFVLMPSWDPHYLIKRPEFKKPVWEDLQKIAPYLT